METKINLSMQDYRRMLRECNGQTVAVDTETTGVMWWRDKVTTVGFHSPQAGVEGCIDIGTEHDLETTTTLKSGKTKRRMKKKAELEELREEWLQSPELNEFDAEVTAITREELQPDTKVIMHNAKFDMGMLDLDKETCNGWKPIDTTVLIHLYDSRMVKAMAKAEPLLLGSNSKRDHVEKAPTTPILKNRIWFWEPEVRQDYCLNDVRVTWQFAEYLMPKIRQLDLEDLFWKDMRYLKLVYHTEHLGILLNQDFTVKAQQALLGHTKELEQQLWDAVGYKFNWRSHKVLSKALYEDLGIEKPNNARGKNKTETMTSTPILCGTIKHPLGELIAAIREADKFRKTCNQWLELVDENSVIHSNYNITGTRTGRLSSSKPNLANLPTSIRSHYIQGDFTDGNERTDEYSLRNALQARSGHWILSIDYKQQEMRMFAWISKDPLLLEFVKSGKDIHMQTALQIWGDCGEDQNKIHRKWAKSFVSFGLLYGMGIESLMAELQMSREKVNEIIALYWKNFSHARQTIRRIENECKQNKLVRYWSKRIWREDAEQHMYKGLNAKVQGGCADLLSIAALRVHKWFQETGEGNIISYIYDELLMEVKKENAEDTANVIAGIMQIPDVLDLAFLTECKIGTTYGDTVNMDRTEEGRWVFPQEFKEKNTMPNKAAFPVRQLEHGHFKFLAENGIILCKRSKLKKKWDKHKREDGGKGYSIVAGDVLAFDIDHRIYAKVFYDVCKAAKEYGDVVIDAIIDDEGLKLQYASTKITLYWQHANFARYDVIRPFLDKNLSIPIFGE